MSEALGGGLPEAQQLRHSACCVQSSSASIRSRWRMEIKSHAAFRLLSLRQVARCLCRIPLGVFAASRLVSLHTLCRDRFPSRSVFPICFCVFNSDRFFAPLRGAALVGDRWLPRWNLKCRCAPSARTTLIRQGWKLCMSPRKLWPVDMFSTDIASTRFASIANWILKVLVVQHVGVRRPIWITSQWRLSPLLKRL